MSNLKRMVSQGTMIYHLATVASFMVAAVLLPWRLGGGKFEVPLSGAWAQTAPAASAPARSASAGGTVLVAPARSASAASAPQSAASQAAADEPPAASEPADEPTETPAEPQVFRFNFGDTASDRFGKHAKQFCDFNKIANCNVVQANVDYQLPDGLKPREVKVVHATRRVIRRADQEQSCINLGAAPFNRYGDPKLRLQGIELNPALSPAEKDEAKRLVQQRGDKYLVTADMVFVAMPFRSKAGTVKFVENVRVCMPAQGGRPETIEVWKLSTGKLVADPLSCGNIGPVLMTPRPEPKPEPRPQPQPEPKIPPPARAASTPTATPELQRPNPGYTERRYGDQPEPKVVTLRRYDWDEGEYAGMDRDARFAGAEGAGYPYLSDYSWGRYALGGGGFFGLFEGNTPQQYHFGGRLGAFGLAQKWSLYKGQDIGLKFPMFGLYSEHGGAGAYHNNRHAKLICASLSYNDASREKRGERQLPEWQVWVQFCDAISQSQTQTWLGQPVANGPAIKNILSIGGRVYLAKDFTGVSDGEWARKWQPFVEVGANQTSPFPHTAHVYPFGARTTDKIWSVGMGAHISQAGTLLGGTVNHDTGRHYKLGVQKERWNAMVQGLEAMGVAID